MIEIAGNLHVHTAYSDGTLYHADLIGAAARAGLDFLLTTDHNVYVRGVDGWKTSGDRRVLLLAGEEIHQQDREPQKNHLLVFGARKELSGLASEPQTLIDAVREAGGSAFLAHPDDPAAPMIGEGALDWVSWDVRGFAGLEIWNYMSAFKGLVRNRAAALYFAFFPSLGIRAPDPRTLARWDQLLAAGGRVAAVGGSDAHGSSYTLGPLRKTVFSYGYLFRTVTTHLLLKAPFSGQAEPDSALLLDALRQGGGWVAYDLAKPTRGFRFEATAGGRQTGMGGEIPLAGRPVLEVSLPAPARWRILRAGSGIVQQGSGRKGMHSPAEKGAYRLEARRPFRGRMCGWIFSNPIYVV